MSVAPPFAHLRVPTPATIVPLETESVTGTFGVHTVRLQVQATRAPQLIDLTARVTEVIDVSRIVAGQVTVFCMHTTAAIILNEDEPLLHLDMADYLEQLASSTEGYRHDDLSRRLDDVEPDHGRNAHAHLKQMVLGGSVVVPVMQGRPVLGTFQHLFFLELDRSRPRTVVIQVSGISKP